MKDALVYLDDILEAVALIRSYTKGMNFKDFDAKFETQDAVARRVGIIGEAAKNIPKNLRDLRPEIPWKQVIGMRNIIVHDYAGTSIEQLWDTVTNDLKPLAAAVRFMKKRKTSK